MKHQPNSLRLSSRGARVHFAIAVALISVIPCLTLYYLYISSRDAQLLTPAHWAVAVLGIAGAMCFGYMLLGRYPAVIMRLRSYLQDVAQGELLDEVDLSGGGGQDILAIEEALNIVVGRLRSKLHETEEQRLKLKSELFQSQKLESIGTLASGVAHEINNPIMGIMNYAQLIQDGMNTESPLCKYANEIIVETERVATIVKHLLRFARQDKQFHNSARIIDIVNGTLSLVSAVMRHDQITLSADVPEDLPEIRCRNQQIQQVLMNLLTNARDALNEKYEGHDEDKIMHISAQLISDIGHRMADGGTADVGDGIADIGTMQERKQKQVNLAAPSPISNIRYRYVRITVEDHGVGIPPEVREHMFDPFFTTKPRDKDAGLGLSISHGIVKDHGGELSVESKPGQWTRFYVDLPV